MSISDNSQITIIGAGPAGLTAAYELSKQGYSGTILESDDIVGGLCRTVVRDGYRFDIGGHRFFSKSAEITALWPEMLGESMIRRPRLSRIFYAGKFYDYPLKASNALKNMGPTTALACMTSYMKARVFPNRDPRTLEEWVTNQFGKKLYSMFFKTYTEKVWGIPCSELSADWAAQRIKGLSLGEAVRSAIFGSRGKNVKSLIEEFDYPRLGPGQLWENVAKIVQDKGWKLYTSARVSGLLVKSDKIEAVKAETPDGSVLDIPSANVLSSMPLGELALSCKGEKNLLYNAARSLKYRDFLTAALVFDTEDVFPDNWIYVHSPEVRLGRIQNYKNWSPEMTPDTSKTCLGLEYFCNEGDDLWRMPDDKVIELGYAELKKIGLAKGDLLKGYVVRMPKAYPVYDQGYQDSVSVIRLWADSVEGLYCIGRNGQHRYNNMDHSMMTALIAAGNIARGQRRDPWAVNEDAEYHETEGE